VTYYANELLEELAGRFVFRKQALQALRDMTNNSVVKPAAAAASTKEPEGSSRRASAGK
jgi:hypothetical protein